MRNEYNRLLTRAMLIAFLMFLSITALPKMVSWLMPGKEEFSKKDFFTEVEVNPIIDDPIDDPVDDPVKPEPTKPLPDIKTIRYVTPSPAPDDQVMDDLTIADIDSVDNALIGLEDIDGLDIDITDYDFNNITFGDGKDETKYGDDIPPFDTFVVLEKEPVPVNLDEVKKLIGYPEDAVRLGIEGKITTRVYVNKYGKYVKHVVTSERPNPLLRNAVEKHISKIVMTPGIQGDKPVGVWVTIPFVFTLQ